MATRVARSGYLVRQATDAVRELIARGDIPPGAPLGQSELADRLGISRTPIREAMRILQQEGLVVHVPNHGYCVARLSADELRQVYMMRRFLEHELIATLRSPIRTQLRALEKLNREIEAAVNEGSVRTMVAVNRAFHFGLFQLSPLTLVCAELERLWRLCEPYHAAYLAHPSTRDSMVREHDKMLAALQAGDHTRLEELIDVHRSAAETTLLAFLSRI